jgi:phage baseplate assembly protein W
VNNAATATAVTRAVREALATWEPRIDVLDAYAAPDPSNPSVLVIEINYQVRSTNSRFNLVYPFYLE